ncbi:MAG: hypothetical protein IKV52_04790 [Oscillospiraceae bacterium]|nr:hypothetical protein [Oscillospiraceae bacterium]
MKGLRHNVIEINDTDNDNIERILVFLKPQATEVAIAASRAQASQLLKELEIKKSRRITPKHIAIAVAVVVAVAVAIAVMVV